MTVKKMPVARSHDPANPHCAAQSDSLTRCYIRGLADRYPLCVPVRISNGRNRGLEALSRARGGTSFTKKRRGRSFGNATSRRTVFFAWSCLSLPGYVASFRAVSFRGSGEPCVSRETFDANSACVSTEVVVPAMYPPRQRTPVQRPTLTISVKWRNTTGMAAIEV